ncbi:unnamed protein product [Symbiodinium sp. CCMP2592]|nr:unnamed protein product [Symbiodinium sp. CCMP2592]
MARHPADVTRLPGLPDTDDDDLTAVEPRKAARVTGADDASSPRKGGSQAVTLADLQRLLEAQSAQLQQHQTQQIRDAVGELKMATASELKTLKKEINRQGDYIEQLRDQGDRFEERLAALESKALAQGEPQGGEDKKKNVVVFGGWGSDTHRDQLLPELREMLQKINVLKSFADIFTTGPRRGNALGLVHLVDGESDQDLKRRVVEIVQAVRSAQMAGASMEHGKVLWAAPSKSKLERVRSAHAGKLKRMILEVAEQERTHLDVEWAAGSVWLRARLVGSAVRSKPADVQVLPGKAPQTWVDIATVARLLGCGEQGLRDRWEALMQERGDAEAESQGPLCSDPEQPVEVSTEGSTRNVGVDPTSFFHLQSWNIGGKPIDDALHAVDSGSDGDQLPVVVALQELPRRRAGWHTSVHGHRTLVQYRDDLLQWRGNGVAFDTRHFVCTRRKADQLGVWVRLKQTGTGREYWIGSARFSTGITDDRAAEEAQQLLQLKPTSPHPVILLADFNMKLRWTGEANDRGQVMPTTGRADLVVAELERQGLTLRAPGPDQWLTPTSRPRRSGARGHQIDGVATAGTQHPAVRIIEKSYRQIGGDHDRIAVRLSVPQSHQDDRPKVYTRPRCVVSRPEQVLSINQSTIHSIALRHTAPRPGQRYHDPPEVKRLYRVAKREGSEQTWKTAHRARRSARDQWWTNKVYAASQKGWKDFRELRSLSDDRVGWEVHLSEEAHQAGKEPLKWTIDHFQQIFKETMPETEAEWRKELSQDPVSEQSLLFWMESIRMGCDIPEEWLHTIVTLLPKKTQPATPADLRPISLGSVVGKIFGSMLLGRTRAWLRPTGPEQCAHCGRQTADYVFTAVRLFQLETEWKSGLHFLKLDNAKAYHTLNRSKVLQFLADKLPPVMHREFQCWKKLLAPGVAHIRTPWGLGRVDQTRGIRQGAVESPFIFAIVMEEALHRAQQHQHWPRAVPPLPDLRLGEILFMDDSLLWSASRRDISLKYELLKTALAEWGLRVNPGKTAYYASPYVCDKGPLVLEGQEIPPRAALHVMGIQLQVPLKPAGLMDAGLAKARKKYFASRYVFESRSPIKKRLQTLDMAVGGAALWYSAAVPPTPQGLGAVNSFQLDLVVRMAGFKRRTHETWLEFKTRSVRGARQLLVNSGVERWGTKALKRYWGYMGHAARAASRDEPPPSAVMCYYRPLRWWREQQRERDGVRHPAQFFPYLMNAETKLNRAAGRPDWRDLAQDPVEWKQRETEWLRREDVAWCSGRPTHPGPDPYRSNPSVTLDYSVSFPQLCAGFACITNLLSQDREDLMACVLLLLSAGLLTRDGLAAPEGHRTPRGSQPQHQPAHADESSEEDADDRAWSEGILCLEELAEVLTSAWEADYEVVGMMAEFHLNCTRRTVDVDLQLGGVLSHISLTVSALGLPFFLISHFLASSLAGLRAAHSLPPDIPSDVEECSPAAASREEAAELSPYQVWQLLLGFTEESTLTVTSISQEGILPSYVYNNIIETLMDQDDEDFEAFENDLGQILGDLTVTLRDIVETVRENRRRKQQPDPPAADAPGREGGGPGRDGDDQGGEGDGATEVTAFMQRTVTGVLKGHRPGETRQQTLHADLQQYEDFKAARLSQALLKRLQGQEHNVEECDSVCAVLLAHADPEAEGLCREEEQEWVAKWERLLAGGSRRGEASSSTDPAHVTAALPQMIEVEEETQPNQNDQDVALYEWHLAKKREDEQRQDRNQVAAMAGWSVKPGPKRMRLAVEAGSQTEGGKRMTLDVAEGEEIRLTIRAIMEQGPDEYLYAGRPVEAKEAIEAIRLEEERLDHWQPGDPTSGDQELMYQRWLQSLENDRDIVRAFGFSVLLQYRNRAWEEEQRWRREANQARERRHKEWKRRATEARCEAALQGDDDPSAARRSDAEPEPDEPAHQGDPHEDAGDVRGLPDLPDRAVHQDLPDLPHRAVHQDPAQQDTEPYEDERTSPAVHRGLELPQTAVDDSESEALYRISEEMEQLRALQRMGDDDLYRLWGQGKVTSQQLADAGGQLLVNRLVQRKRRERKAGTAQHGGGETEALGSGQHSEHLRWLREQPRHQVDAMFLSGDITDADVLELWGSRMLRELAQMRWDRRRAEEVTRAEDLAQGGPRRRRGDHSDSGD